MVSLSSCYVILTIYFNDPSEWYILIFESKLSKVIIYLLQYTPVCTIPLWWRIESFYNEFGTIWNTSLSLLPIILAESYKYIKKNNLLYLFL